MIGKVLRGHYKITDLLSGGGGGETYIAVDIDRPRHPQCVVKRLKLPNSDPKVLDTARQLFYREAESLENLGREHKQIPTLLAYFEEEEEFYLVQDLIEGQPLNVELPSGHRWSEAKVVQLLYDVLTIMEFIHHKGVIHRDIKPANLIRRQQDGKLVLIDFGAVKQIQQDPLAPAPINPTTIAIGTEGYMPTEQVRGKPRPNSDIYALGIIGIQAITGINPGNLQEDQDGEVIWRSHVPQMSEDLAAILTKMVRYHFKDRYQSATEVLQALQPLIDRHFNQSASQPASSSLSESSANIDFAQSSMGANINQIPSRSDDSSVIVDQLPETRFSFPAAFPQSGNRAGRLLRWVPNGRRLIVGLGVVVVAISIPTGIWLLRPKPATNPASIAPQPERTGKNPPIESSPTNSETLKGDYSKLQSYLQNHNWKDADEETYKMMLKVAGPESEKQGYFSKQEWDKFSCSDFKEIDRLWSKASKGQLGFTAQKRIFEAVVQEFTLEEVRENPNLFYGRIRWRDSTEKFAPKTVEWAGSPLDYVAGKQPDFTAPPEGHLPAKLTWAPPSGDLRFDLIKRCIRSN